MYICMYSKPSPSPSPSPSASSCFRQKAFGFESLTAFYQRRRFSFLQFFFFFSSKGVTQIHRLMPRERASALNDVVQAYNSRHFSEAELSLLIGPAQPLVPLLYTAAA